MNKEAELRFAVIKGDLNKVQELIKTGADVNAKTAYGVTPLILVALMDHTEIVEALIQAGADVNAKDNDGNTALICAASQGYIEIAKALIKARADVNAKDDGKDTALIVAAFRGHTEIVKALIQAGSDLDAKNNNGKTALDYAKEQGYSQIIKILEQAAQAKASQITEETPTVDSGIKEVEEEEGNVRELDVEVDDGGMSEEEQIAYYINNGFTFMLHGASGIGKTARIRAIDPDLTSVPLWNGVLPEDVLGKDVVLDDKKTEWIAPSWYTELCRKAAAEPDRQHVLFIDEVTNARVTTQSLILNLVLNREVKAGKGKLPDNVTIVLAGNSKEESGAAYNMPEPLFRRMYAHIYLKENITDWIEWGNKRKKGAEERQNIHPLVSGFVATQGKKVFRTAYEEDQEEAVVQDQYAVDPRGWEQISDIIYSNAGRVRRDLILNKLGPELTAGFMAYAKNPLLTLKEVVNGKYTAEDIPQREDAKIALVGGLSRANDDEYEIVRKFIEKNLGGEKVALYDQQWAEDNEDRLVKVAQVRAKNKRKKAKKVAKQNVNVLQETKETKKDLDMIQAAKNGDLNKVQELLKAWADVNAKSYGGYTALMWAALEGHTEIVEALIQAGADVNAKNNDGETALMWAALHGYKEIAKALIKVGADVNAKNNDDKTALIYAASYSHPDIVKALIEAGVDLNIKDRWGKTALIWAVRSENLEMAEALIQAGADVNVKDNDGKIAFNYAKEFGYTKVTRILKQAQQKTKLGNTATGATKIASQESVFAKATKSIFKIVRNVREA